MNIRLLLETEAKSWKVVLVAQSNLGYRQSHVSHETSRRAASI